MLCLAELQPIAPNQVTARQSRSAISLAVSADAEAIRCISRTRATAVERLLRAGTRVPTGPPSDWHSAVAAAYFIATALAAGLTRQSNDDVRLMTVACCFITGTAADRIVQSLCVSSSCLWHYTRFCSDCFTVGYKNSVQLFFLQQLWQM